MADRALHVILAGPLLVPILISVALSVALSVVRMLLTPRPSQPQQQQQQQPQVPKAADGKYNLKQNVPSLTKVYGRVKKAGDYVFLGEKDGRAYHLIVWAGHRIEGFVQHWLHDEPVTLNDVGGVTAPGHFAPGGDPKVIITVRNGADSSNAYVPLVTNFPEWTDDHRGDGLATVLMIARAVSQEDFATVFPQQSPQHSAVGDGALLYDPRTGRTAFSTNIALMRFDHLTSPAGGKWRRSDMYLPDWIAAADVCDQTVTNRAGGSESRYHGGFWFYESNDPVDVGRKLDEAADLVVYERPDGTVGVHAGAYVAPDIRLTADDIITLRYDANRRQASTVLAVRGRFTSPAADYNTVDAALYGDPYGAIGDDTQRTSTLDNEVVQSHNHSQRLQKLKFIRANAPRISLTIHFRAAHPSRFVAYRRFVDVHYPSRGLDEAVVEIVGRPKLSLRNLTIAFDAIVVSAALYDFDAAAEEGEPPALGVSTAGTGVPLPASFAVAMEVGTLRALASWDPPGTEDDDALTYELEWQRSDLSTPPQRATSQPGEVELLSGVLVDQVDYTFRLRTLSNGATSAWTADGTLTAVLDPVAPDPPSGLSTSDLGGGAIFIQWTDPNSANLNHVDLLRAATSTFADAAVIFTSYAGPLAAVYYTDTVGSGDWWWWVRSVNGSGVASAPAGPETETV